MIEINALGKSCPIPLLMLKKALKQHNHIINDVLLLKSSDIHSRIDIQHYCQLHGLECNLNEVSEQEFHFLITHTQYTDK